MPEFMPPSEQEELTLQTNQPPSDSQSHYFMDLLSPATLADFGTIHKSHNKGTIHYVTINNSGPQDTRVSDLLTHDSAHVSPLNIEKRTQEIQILGSFANMDAQDHGLERVLTCNEGPFSQKNLGAPDSSFFNTNSSTNVIHLPSPQKFSEEVFKQLHVGLTQNILDQQTAFLITLNPQNLGWIHIQIHSQSNFFDIKVSVSNPDVKNMLKIQSPQLKQLLDKIIEQNTMMSDSFSSNIVIL